MADEQTGSIAVKGADSARKTTQSSIETTRLVLRPFFPDDAEAVTRLAGDRKIAATTLNIPHPYEDGMAETWIATHGPGFSAGSSATFAIVSCGDDALIGAIGLSIDRPFDCAELGYWVGRPFWNRGYATEAAAALAEFGFAVLKLNRISARHLARNPASGRVMEKLGMRREGTARQAVKKWGQYEDLVLYGLLRQDWRRG
jgi:RimJ/RimL family protein N-acetyltransferase